MPFTDPDYLAAKRAAALRAAQTTGTADTLERQATTTTTSGGLTPTYISNQENDALRAAAVTRLETPTIDPPPPTQNNFLNDSGVGAESFSSPYYENTPYQQADNSNWNMNLNERLNMLAKSLGISLANADEDEQQLGLGWDAKLRQLERGLSDRLRGNSVRNADRGLTQSGIALQLDTDVRQRADEDRGYNQQSYNNDLQAVARRKLAAEAEFNLNKLNVQSQMKGL